MKIALVEDNGLHQAQIRQEIQNYFDELNEVCELHVFDNGSDMICCCLTFSCPAWMV